MVGTIPEGCSKCGGLVVWDTEDTFRCMMCAKRFYYFQNAATAYSAILMRQTRVQRDKVAHALYMRYYMRRYRERRRERP